MAYEITVYPLLELAEARYARDPKRDPTEHGPLSVGAREHKRRYLRTRHFSAHAW